ncbi:transcription factor [Candidatus Scalindua japonica]|uniref:Transcription factor n=1 Tax=Candidatus Scalindua japonica TaxID=1284222 RepID=A0A286TUU7_9BACT|nr:transcription factor [Candidatus Scalindua japonica]
MFLKCVNKENFKLFIKCVKNMQRIKINVIVPTATEALLIINCKEYPIVGELNIAVEIRAVIRKKRVQTKDKIEPADA